jgi:hypothetical protein
MYSKLRWIFGIVFSILCICSSIAVDAYQNSLDSTIRTSNKIVGDWYDTSGNKVLTISNGYINGCPIVDGADFVGGYPGAGVFIIQEAQGRKAIHLQWMGYGEHKTLIINKKVQLSTIPQRQHYESVNGVYLGMTKQEVIDLLGVPSDPVDSRGRETLKFNNLGISVELDHGVVTVINLIGDNARFEKSGLTRESSLIEYYNFYQFSRMPSELSKDTFQGCFSIGHGEYIAFSDGNVSLTIYSN